MAGQTASHCERNLGDTGPQGSDATL